VVGGPGPDPAAVMSTEMGVAAFQQAPGEQFRVPSPPRGFQVPTPAEMANAVMEPLAGTPGAGSPTAPNTQSTPPPDGAPPQGMGPDGQVAMPGAVPVLSPDGQPGDPQQEAQYGQAPGRASSIGPDAVGQKFQDFVAPAGPMHTMPQGNVSAKGIGKGIVAGIAIVCLLVGGGVGFVVGQSTAAAGAAPGTAENGAGTDGVPDSPDEPENGVETNLTTDAGAAEASADSADAAVALAAVTDAAAPLEAGATTPAIAITPTVPDPGELGEGECALAIKVVPADAVITIKAPEAHKLPKGATKANVPCGLHSLTIVHAKYKNHKGRILLKPTRENVLVHSLKRPVVKLEIISVPKRALVTLGGEDLGRTPIKRKIPAYDPIELKLVRSGYKPHIQSIVADGPTKLKIKLKKRGRRGKKRRRGIKRKSPIKL
jgi:hypothetical protein